MPFPVYEAEAGLDLSELVEGRLTVFGGVLRPGAAARGSADAVAKKACAKCGGEVEAKGDKYTCATCEDDDAETVDAADHTLYPLRSLVVSTGFNLNGHFFPAEDLWAAKGTVANKPFNLEHVKDDIIGHAVRGWPVDATLAPLDPAGPPPAAFHVMDESVIYLWRPTARGAALAETLDALDRGEYWVSMECIYLDFDYAVGHSATGKFTDVASPQLIKRTPETAHLTKYLRTVKQADGSRGTGRLPDGRLIGQALRQITFTGKGLVKAPANPASAVYTVDGRLLSGVLPAAEGGVPSSVYTPTDPHTDPAMTLEQALAEVSRLTAEAALAQATIAATAKAKDELEAAHAAALLAAQTELAAAKAELDAAKKQLSDAAEAKRLADRTSQLKSALKLDDDAAAKLAASLVVLPDEAFAAHLEGVKLLVESKPAAPAKPDPLPAQATIVPDPTPAPPAAPAKPKANAAAGTKGLLTKFNGSK
jgi:hypothetical protein